MPLPDPILEAFTTPCVADRVRHAVAETLRAEARLAEYFARGGGIRELEVLNPAQLLDRKSTGRKPRLRVALAALLDEPQLSSVTEQEVTVYLWYEDLRPDGELIALDGAGATAPVTTATVVDALVRALRGNDVLQGTAASADPLAQRLRDLGAVDLADVPSEALRLRTVLLTARYEVALDTLTRESLT